MLRYFSLWASIGWLLVMITCYLSLIPNPPGIDIELQHLDKLGHFFTYFVLMFWFSQLYKTAILRAGYILFFIAIGVALEVIQGMGGVRFFEYADMLANSSGVLFAWFITRGKLRNVLLSFEQVMIKSDS